MDDSFKIYGVLIKFMDEQRVASFLNEGLLYMNNIDCFRKYEDTNVSLRRDHHEGLSASYLPENSTITFNDIVLEGLADKVDVRYNHEDNTNIYSMTKISYGAIHEAGKSGFYLSEDFIRFGNRAVIITGSKITEFENKLKLAVSNDPNIYTLRKDKVIARQVSYLNRNEHDGKMDVFNKFSDYSWQHEWRIAFKQRATSGSYDLKIGRLSDIAQAYETKEILDKPMKLVPKCPHAELKEK